MDYESANRKAAIRTRLRDFGFCRRFRRHFFSLPEKKFWLLNSARNAAGLAGMKPGKSSIRRTHCGLPAPLRMQRHLLGDAGRR
ncbi:MAG: hypothetical protein FJX29_06115 [Alphaproteobacteria bacterium]|nr:hypothetical protein [Alphaproteobacteria bacterium]